jgi:hypothetical protein
MIEVGLETQRNREMKLMRYFDFVAGTILFLGLAQPSQAFTLKQCESWCKVDNGGDDLVCVACDQTRAILNALNHSENPISCTNNANLAFGVRSRQVQIENSWLSLDFENTEINVGQAHPAYNAPGGTELPVSIKLSGQFSSIMNSNLATHFRPGAPVAVEFAFVAPLFRRAIRFAYHKVVLSSPEQKCLEWATDYGGEYCTNFAGRIEFVGCRFPRIVVQ